jgi:hypothetical protein
LIAKISAIPLGSSKSPLARHIVRNRRRYWCFARHRLLLLSQSVAAFEQSRHSKDGSLLSYLVHVADEFPGLYISLLGRLVPVEAKLKTNFERPQRLTVDMPLSEMISAFEAKIKNPDYQPVPRVIGHSSDDDDDGFEQ